jgi:membrane-bound lytic murein transglycosylase A
MAAFGRAWLSVAIVLGLAGFANAGRCAEREPIKFPDTQYEPVEWTSLDGWATDDHATAFATFLESCRALNGSRQSSAESSTIADALRAVCVRAVAAVPLEEDGARKFFEDNFRPLRISKLGDSDGFLTGYYEPIIEGSRVPTGEFTVRLISPSPAGASWATPFRAKA